MTQKHPGGRPTNYKPEYCKQLTDFFAVPKYERVVKSVTTGKNYYEKTEYTFVPTDLPMFSAFARKVGVSHQTLLTWTKKHPEFLEAYTSAKEMQKEFLVVNGLRGLYPPASYIFTAKNVTDMRDEQYLDHTSKGKAISTPTVIKVIQPAAKPENAE